MFKPKVNCFSKLLLLGLFCLLFSSAAAATDESDNYLQRLLRLAENNNDPEAMFALALSYDYAQGDPVTVRSDRQRAVYWLRKSADQGVAGACLYLAIKYEFGATVDQDYKKAAFYYRKAAEQGWPSGCFYLAGLYQRGKGVIKNEFAALCLYQMAAKAFYPGAAEQSAELLQVMVISFTSRVDPDSVILPDCTFP